MSLRYLRTAIRRLDGLADMDAYDISQARVKIALDSAQMEALPFVYGSMAVLFIAYALLQAFVLQENGRLLMVAVALASAAFLFVGRQILRRGLVPPHWSEQGTAVVAGLILISILLRLYLTGDPNQAANLALFLFGMGVLFISPGWYLGVSLFSLAAFGIFVTVLPPSEDWIYFTVMNLAALATGMIAHVVRVRAFRRTEILRIVEQMQRQELQRRTVQQQTSYAVGQRITSILELDELLNQIADLVWERFRSYYVGLFLPEPDSLTIQAVAEAGRAVPPEGLHLRAGLKGLVGWVMAKGETLYLEDVTRDYRYDAAEKAPQTRSELLLPLKMGERVLGVLDLQSDRRSGFVPDDISAYQLLANQVAISLENARLYSEIKAFNQQLEAKVAERTQALQAAYNQLERMDRTKADFITIASHELRTPLTIVNFNNQMLLDEPDIQANEEYAKWTAGIHRGVSRMEEVVESMLDVAKIDSQALDLHPTPLELSFLVRQMANRFKRPLSERRITLDIQTADLPEIEADAEAMQKVFYHLIVNGIKYTPDGGKITISIRPFTQEQPNGAPPEAVEVIVADTGIGIAPDVQELIFEKFYQTGEVKLHSSGKTNFKGGGAGLGLAIVRGIVTAHNGRIWVESDGYDESNCPGSRFHLVLPIRHPPQ